VRSRASTAVTFARVLTVSFVGYFALIIFCELTRPESFGADLSWPEGQAVIARHHARDVRQPLRDTRPDLADGFIDVVDRALARDVRRRISSAGALETAMRSV
jgi:hypothetical protein